MAARLRRLATLLLTAPVVLGAAPRALTLGLVAPSTEADATSLVRGVELAVAEANSADAAPVRLEVRSGSGQWGSVGNDAVALVCERHADALITSSDGADTHLILQVTGRTRVPVASLCADSSVTGAGVPWAIRVVPRTEQQAAVVFHAARGAAGERLSWCAVIPSGRAGREIRRDLETAARACGLPSGRFFAAGSAAAIVDLTHEISAAAPGLVLLWLPPTPAGRLAAALRRAGYRGRLAGPCVLASPEFVASAGAAANGFLVPGLRGGSDAAMRAGAFARQYRQRYATEPDFSSAAAHDAAIVLIALLRRAGAGDVYRRFPPSDPISGVTGGLHFDASGNRTDALDLLIGRDGRFVPAQ